MSKYIIVLAVASIVAGGTPAGAIIADHAAPNFKGEASDSPIVEITAVQRDVSPDAALAPDNRVWNSVPSGSLPLFPQSISPPYGGGSTSAASVQVLRLDGGIAVRLTWDDATCDDARSPSQFKDGAAVEFPIRPQVGAALEMGQEGGPVNIWHWMAAEGRSTRKSKRLSGAIEELVAAGHYNKTAKSTQLGQGRGLWHDNSWSVVFFKPYGTADASSPDFEKEEDLPLAVAIWNGSANERLGLKSVSQWSMLHFH